MKKSLLLAGLLLLLSLISAPASAQYRVTNPGPDAEDACKTNEAFVCASFDNMAAGAIPFYVGGYKDTGWSDNSFGNFTIVTSAQVPGGCFRGNQCLRMRTPNGKSSGGSIEQAWDPSRKTIGPNSYRETYWRWYQKFDNNYVFSNVGTKGLEWFSAAGGGETGTFNSVQQTGVTTPGITIITPAGLVPPFDGVYHLLQNRNGAPLSWVKNQWYCLEMHLKYNSGASTPDAIVEAWIQRVGIDPDPVLKWDYSGFVVDSRPNNSMIGLWLVSYINCNVCVDPPACISCVEQNGNRDKYIDDIIVSTARVGCGGVVQVPPTPNPPTNWRFTLLTLGPLGLAGVGMLVLRRR